MGLQAGVIGLPNVGKSTVFNALTNGHAADENYPFCTIDPNVGVVAIPDRRLDRLAGFFPDAKVVPASIEVIDIAGLVKGASRGEGLGNRFLAKVREVDALIHVVRCFDDKNVVHVEGAPDPERDVALLELELILSDLEVVTRRLKRIAKRTEAPFKKERGILEGVLELLDQGVWLGRRAWSREDLDVLNPLFLLSMKPVLFVANVDEDDFSGRSPHAAALRRTAQSSGGGLVVISAKIEAELVDWNDDERLEFLAAYGTERSALESLAQEIYRVLGLHHFFSTTSQEVHAWTIPHGTLAPQAAGVIHTDFEKGFIRAEVYDLDDLIRCGSEAELKNSGRMRLEGKTYEVRDGDVIRFRFQAG